MKFFGFLLLFGVSTLFAQQLDQVGKKGAFKISGGASLNQNLYLSNGVSRVAPYSFIASGNITASYAGISFPVTFNYSNQNFSVSRQPFNIVGVSPTYKNLTLHAGFRNMSFSPYTLSGHNFLGGGIEWKGKKFNVAAMGGRLLKGVAFDSTNQGNLPAYERWGAGAKVGLSNKVGDNLQVIVFGARDNINSIATPPARAGVTPQENMVLGLGFTKVLAKKLSLQAEATRSAWTRDLQTDLIVSPESKVINAPFLIQQRQSTKYFGAYKANISYKFNFLTAGVGVERVDPEYRTLGAYYVANDLQNLTLNLSSNSLLKKKLTLSGNIGLQQDNLNRTKTSEMKRWVGAVNASYVPSKRLNLNFSYSNFTSFTTVQPIDARFLQVAGIQQFDSLNFVQISHSLNGGLGYKISESDHTQRNINFSSSVQRSANTQNSTTQSTGNINASTGYQQAWKKSGLSLGVNFNGSQASFTTGKSVFLGLGINSSIPLYKKKLKTTITANANNNYENSNWVSTILTVANGYSIRIGKHQSLNLSLRYMLRQKRAESQYSIYNKPFNELITSLGYSYSF